MQKNKLKLLSYHYDKDTHKLAINKRLEDLESLLDALGNDEPLFFYAGFKIPTNDTQQAAIRLLKHGCVLNRALIALLGDEVDVDSVFICEDTQLFIYSGQTLSCDGINPFNGLIHNAPNVSPEAEPTIEYHDDTSFDADILWLINNGFARDVFSRYGIFKLYSLQTHYAKIPDNVGLKALEALFNRVLKDTPAHNDTDSMAHSIVSLARYLPSDKAITEEFSVRTSNVFKQNFIAHYGQFASMNARQLKGLPHFGLKSMVELLTVMKSLYQANLMQPSIVENVKGWSVFNNVLNQQHPTMNQATIAAYIIQLCKVVPDNIAIIEMFSVRTTNVLSENNINFYSDFAGFTVSNFLALPKLGQKTLHEIYVAVQQLPEKYGVAQDDTHDSDSTVKAKPISLYEPADEQTVSFTEFMEALRSLSEGLSNEKHKNIAMARLSGETLEDVAQPLGITRERVRQIQALTIKNLCTLINHSLLESHQDIHCVSLFLRALLIEDHPVDNIGDFVRYVDLMKVNAKNTFIITFINKVLEAGKVKLRVSFCSVDDETYLLPFYEKVDVDEAIKSMKVWLVTQKEQSVDKICNDSVLIHQEYSSPYYIKIMTMVLISHAGVIRDSVFTSDDWKPEQVLSRVATILNASGKPMKLDDIYHSMPESYKTRYEDSRRLTSIIQSNQQPQYAMRDSYIFSLSWGMWCTWQHTKLTDVSGQYITDAIQALLSAKQDFQFSDKLIFDSLVTRVVELQKFKDQGLFSPHIISVCLHRYRPALVQYLGRYNWKFGEWSDTPNTEERLTYGDMLKDYLLEHQQLVTEKDFIAHMSQHRGGSKTSRYQMPRIDNVIWLTGNGNDQYIWHIGLNPIDPSAEEAHIIFNEAHHLIGKERSFTNLKFMLRNSKPIIREHRIQDFQLAALLCQASNIQGFIRDDKLWFTQNTEAK